MSRPCLRGAAARGTAGSEEEGRLLLAPPGEGAGSRLWTVVPPFCPLSLWPAPPPPGLPRGHLCLRLLQAALKAEERPRTPAPALCHPW